MIRHHLPDQKNFFYNSFFFCHYYIFIVLMLHPRHVKISEHFVLERKDLDIRVSGWKFSESDLFKKKSEVMRFHITFYNEYNIETSTRECGRRPVQLFLYVFCDTCYKTSVVQKLNIHTLYIKKVLSEVVRLSV